MIPGTQYLGKHCKHGRPASRQLEHYEEKGMELATWRYSLNHGYSGMGPVGFGGLRTCRQADQEALGTKSNILSGSIWVGGNPGRHRTGNIAPELGSGTGDDVSDVASG